MNFHYKKMDPSSHTSGAERIGGKQIGSEGRIGSRQQSPHGGATVHVQAMVECRDALFMQAFF
jgi:hypothetical protein